MNCINKIFTPISRILLLVSDVNKGAQKQGHHTIKPVFIYTREYAESSNMAVVNAERMLAKCRNGSGVTRNSAPFGRPEHATAGRPPSQHHNVYGP